MREVAAARAQVRTIDASVSANTERLDALITKQERLEQQLDARASYMYRSGPLGFIEVLGRSDSFDEFSKRWEQLRRVARHEADMIRELKRTRAEIAQAAEQLRAQQQKASSELRRVEAAEAKARRELANDRARYAEYRRRIAAIEAQQKAAAAPAAPRRAATAAARPAPSPRPQATGSGSWSSGVASCYGSGSYGARTASGVVIGPDSMIVAHKTLPFGTLIEFSLNGRTAVASVEDRGPFVAGREFDLGPGVWRILGFYGVETVRYRIISR